ncbi:MAG TPA: iron uptake transporter deferrochelatase/peroxidase subunit [Verrucomicrobiae bacterium]|jgi:deferrochelatase/peroxidase EfeB
MSKDDSQLRLSRRRFLATSGGLAALAGAGAGANASPEIVESAKAAGEPFWGVHQGGILTPAQGHTYFAAFDLVGNQRDDVVQLLKDWTAASARMTKGEPAAPLGEDTSVPAADSGDVLGLPPSRLTLTFGFGAGMFVKDGKARYGLASRRPAALVDMPKFTGDQLVESRTGGDISVQACADDPQVAFHAVRQLARLAYDVAQIRWVQTGFVPNFGTPETHRNLMGFKDGTNNPSTKDARTMEKFVWVGDEGPDWMRDGSYLVVRRIRIALEHWDRMNLAFQEQTVGRQKYSGAPIGGTKEFDKPDLDATDKDGNPVIAENSHVRLASAANNDGAQILRRPYSYNDGANVTAERWPPWRQEMEFDAGLFFVAYQRDPRTGFIKIFEKMAKFDMMNQFVTHVGGGLFACPGGVTEGRFIGQRLFEKA